MNQQFITPVDVARAAGLSDSTVRRFLRETRPKTTGYRTRQKFDAGELAGLVALCRSSQKRKRLNRFNAIPIPTP